MNGILLFLGYEKAFDTMIWNGMITWLKIINFGHFYVDAIKTLYANITTCITSNGHASRFLKPTRGIRQGCPISANLFIIVVEILANAIRKNCCTQGINISGGEFKIVQYADDTCLFLKSEHKICIWL